MKPEEKAELILWDWLKTKSTKVIEVYFNRVNLLNAPVFNTKGLNKKPDLIIKFDRGYGIQYCAVEVKSSDQSKNIHDARKIMDYYKNYIYKKTKYFINNEEIILSHFVIASENSPKGYLFFDEKTIITNESSGDSWRVTNAKYKLEPTKEYSLSSMWLRRLWADFRNFRKEIKEEKFVNLPSLGIIMSNFSEEDFSPYLFIMNKNSHISNKWGARWWKL